MCQKIEKHNEVNDENKTGVDIHFHHRFINFLLA